MKSWLELITSRPVAVGMLTLALVVFGLIALDRLPIDLLPDINYPSLTIQTELPDAAPQEVEQLITTPIEQVVGVVNGVVRLHSSSRPGVSEVTLEFAWGTDMALVSLDTREKLDLVELPDDAVSPIVYRFEPDLDPIIRVAISGDRPVRELRRLAEDTVKKKLETTDGVAAAKTVGGAEEEVIVEVDEGRLTALGLNIDDVVSSIQEENVNRSGGELRDDRNAYMVRTVNQFKSLEDLENTIVRETSDGRVRLADIGLAHFGQRDREVRVRVNGQSAVEVHVYKAGDANTVEVAHAVRERIDTLRESALLRGTKLEVLFDQAQTIEESVQNVIETAVLGAILAALVLFLFLGNLRSTLLVALSIPISVTITFLFMHLSGITLNVMSLGGLALGIGMLVDSSVVVLEAIQRRTEEGTSGREATIRGTGEVLGGIAASTLTTIAVFLPLIFVEGIAGQIFHDQALTVTYSLVASLFVAMTIIPCAMANSGNGSRGLVSRLVTTVTAPVALFRHFIRGVTASYKTLLSRVVAQPVLAPVSALVLFGGTVTLIDDLATELVPDLSQGHFYYELELPEGTPIDVTDSKVQRMEALVERLATSESLPIDAYYVSVGGTPVLGDLSAGERRDHVAQVHVALKEGVDAREEQRIIARLDAALGELPDSPVTLSKPTLFTFRDPIEIEVYAPELAELRQAAEITTAALEGIEGLIDPQSRMAEAAKEYHVVLDPAKLAAVGLTQGNVANVLRAKGLGELAGQFMHHEKPIDIRVQVIGARDAGLDETSRRSLPIEESAANIPLGALGRLERGEGPVEIVHVGGERAALVSARMDGVDLGGLTERIQTRLDDTLLPPTATAQLSGQNEEMRSSLGSLRFALLLAVFLVYLVLASNFESLRLPLVIILTVPLGIIGAIGALWLTSMPLGVLSMIGFIFLSGIVVNNGIIFIGRIQQHRLQGESPTGAAVRAGTERIRPILITSATTILGLLPLAIGLGVGAELRQPLAVTVIGGLTVATALTLFVIPCGYLLLTGKPRTAEAAE